MNVRKLLITVVAFAIASSSAVMAQEKKKGGGRGGMSVERVEEAVGTLTAEQKKKIEAIVAKSREEMQALSQEDRQTKGREIMQGVRTQIRAVLTPEQQKKFDEMPQGGAGAAGEVTLYEATAHPLAKVRVSGGGRCNVTHACFEPRELVKRYPRGGRELLGAFHRFQPRDTVAWFAARGVETKTEEDGRMFPVTDDSATIVECLTRAAATAGVRVVTSLGVRKVERVNREGDAPSFWVTLTDGTGVRCDRLLLATGGNRSSAGFTVAESLGHTIEPLVPSLFTFHIDDARLIGLSGVSVENVVTSVPGTKLKESGPVLITHWGLSGPAILKLSAWGARELAALKYEFPLVVNFAPPHTRDSLIRELAGVREKNPRKHIATWSPLAMPQRLWERVRMHGPPRLGRLFPNQKFAQLR